jgi:hypothetical protein
MTCRTPSGRFVDVTFIDKSEGVRMKFAVVLSVASILVSVLAAASVLLKK